MSGSCVGLDLKCADTMRATTFRISCSSVLWANPSGHHRLMNARLGLETYCRQPLYQITVPYPPNSPAARGVRSSRRS